MKKFLGGNTTVSVYTDVVKYFSKSNSAILYTSQAWTFMYHR